MCAHCIACMALYCCSCERERLRLPRQSVPRKRVCLQPGTLFHTALRLQVFSKLMRNNGDRSRFHSQSEYVSEGYDTSNIASTYAALCILRTLGDDLSRVNKPAVIGALRHLQNKQTGRCECVTCTIS